MNNLPLHVAVCTKFLMFEIALKLSASNTNMLFGSLPISFSSLMSKPPTPIANIVIPAALAESDGPWTSSPDRPSVMTTPTRGMLSDVGLAPPLALNKSFLIRSIALACVCSAASVTGKMNKWNRWKGLKALRGVEWVHGLFLFPFDLGKM